MTRSPRPVSGNEFAVAIVLEGLSDEGGTEAQASALAERLAWIGYPTLFASRWPLYHRGERVARLRSAGVDIVTPKWADSKAGRLGVSSYNIRRTVRAGQLAIRRGVLPTAGALAADEEALRARHHDVTSILVQKLRRWARGKRPLPTVLHVLARHTAVVIPELRRLGLPIVYTELGQADYYTGGHASGYPVDADAITADSTVAAEAIRSRDERDVAVIPSIGGFPEPTTPPSLHGTRFVMVNRLHPDKRIEMAIRAIASAGPQFSLEVLGSGPSFTELQTLVHTLAVSDRVSLHGAVDRNRVKAALDAADAYVLASSTEGTPTSVLEAMSRARCVMAAPVGGLPDLVRHGEDGLFFDGTVGGLAMSVRRLADEAGLARDLGRAARTRWEASLSPETIVPRYESVYRKALVTHSRSSEVHR